ncbi:MAG: gluconokinase [Verrucomicrobiota bacterium]
MSKIVVIMGVSGCGKSTIGELLAERSGGAYFDGDDFHPPENVEKMRAGIPLKDDDRVGWMKALGDLIIERKAADAWTFIACSALRRQFRDGLREVDPQLRFLFLKGDFDLVHGRLAQREGHYMPSSLLQSQYDALEEPEDDEELLDIVGIEDEPDAITAAAAELLFG